MDKKTQKLLDKFAAELKRDLGANLRSLILYGSGARGDFVPGRSDVNLMLILKSADYDSLGKIGRLARKYRSKRFATPVAADLEYLEGSLDVFPIEFEEIRRHHRIIFGEDLISGLQISRDHLRLQLEREFKQNLLWLRELLIEDPDFSGAFSRGLLNACRSLYTHLRALALLAPESEAPGPGMVEKVESISGAKLPGLRRLIQLRAQARAPKKAELKKLIPGLLEELKVLTKWLDQMEKRK